MFLLNPSLIVKEVIIVKEVVIVKEVIIEIEVIIVKEVISCDGSPVVMFCFQHLSEPEI